VPRLGRGFNLLGLFVWRGQAPPAFDPADFELVARWGFEFLRLPTDYRFLWRDGRFEEAGWEVVDAAVRLAERYGLHLNLNLHHAPGFCINTPRDQWTLWTDEAAQQANAAIWRFAALRYRGEGRHLSFNLLNEPTGCDLATYEGFVRRMVAEIRAVDPARLIVADGHEVGTRPLPGVVDLGIAQSVHCYAPHWLTHYRAPWVYRDGDPYVEPPSWPGREPRRRGEGEEEAARHRWWDREQLALWLEPWVELQRRGVLVHCGELGVYRETPRAAQLAWYRDLLGLLRERDIDWALWNLEGSFGVIESGRADVRWEPMPDGRRLDRELLELLQAH
jgi:endoglucanase